MCARTNFVVLVCVCVVLKQKKNEITREPNATTFFSLFPFSPLGLNTHDK